MIDEGNLWTYGVYHLDQQRKRYNSLNIETIQPRTCFPYRDCVWLNIWYRIFQLFQSSKDVIPTSVSRISLARPMFWCAFGCIKKQPRYSILPSPWNRSLKGWCFYTAGGIFRHDLIYIHRFAFMERPTVVELVILPVYRIRLIHQPASYESSPDTKPQKNKKEIRKKPNTSLEIQHQLLHRFI